MRARRRRDGQASVAEGPEHPSRRGSTFTGEAMRRSSGRCRLALAAVLYGLRREGGPRGRERQRERERKERARGPGRTTQKEVVPNLREVWGFVRRHFVRLSMSLEDEFEIKMSISPFGIGLGISLEMLQEYLRPRASIDRCRLRTSVGATARLQDCFVFSCCVLLQGTCVQRRHGVVRGRAEGM
ncbi:hypothetical protein BRADI_3g10845v3 [Brachypodium distachyon]|uniref:Uncharacterized protein n=1 Tax=Brachypodium distachyon TaxID=15368 RepID=A0A0Q3J8J2_BRADI|nr:hypothetical protein BRADI_3g10845v3 [Brachypodium distachyon]